MGSNPAVLRHLSSPFHIYKFIFNAGVSITFNIRLLSVRSIQQRRVVLTNKRSSSMQTSFFMCLKRVSKYVEKGLVENIIGSLIKTLCSFKTNTMKERDDNRYINSVRESEKRRKIIVERSFEVEVCNEIAAVSPLHSIFTFRDPKPTI